LILFKILLSQSKQLKATQSNSKQLKATQSNSSLATKQSIKLLKPFRVLSRSFLRRMSAVATQTFAAIYKERMMNMPDELNAKKDIDEYSKKITKEIKEEVKNLKVEKAEKKKDDKKKKRNNLDEDGNEKPKRPLTKYQQYIKDNQQRIREEFPELSNTERFSKLAEEWKAYKATLEVTEDAAGAEEAEEAEEHEEAAGAEEAEQEPEVVEVKEDEKPKKPKKMAKTEKKKVKDSE
jgi:hypothetical protein